MNVTAAPRGLLYFGVDITVVNVAAVYVLAARNFPTELDFASGVLSWLDMLMPNSAGPAPPVRIRLLLK